MRCDVTLVEMYYDVKERSTYQRIIAQHQKFGINYISYVRLKSTINYPRTNTLEKSKDIVQTLCAINLAQSRDQDTHFYGDDFKVTIMMIIIIRDQMLLIKLSVLI